MKEITKQHYNPAQLLAYAVFAQQMGLIMGRATGKTGGGTAPFSARNAIAMPRSTGGLLAPSYTSLAEKILPETIIGFERLGLIEGKHFVVGLKPPFKDKTGKPLLAYRHPRREYDHYISFCNGSGIFLLSGDRAINNGASLHHLVIEEARLLKEAKYAELMPTLRGEESIFGHLSNHKSSLFVTDMPKYPHEKWILGLIKEVDNEAVKRILQIEAWLKKLYEEYLNPLTLPYRKTIIEKKCANLENALHLFRKKTPFLVKADTLTNIHALGIQTIKNFRRTLDPHDYTTSVMNEEITTTEKSFYPAFNPTYEGHAYEAMKYSFTDSLGVQLYKHERDCRWDADLNPYQPISIALDYNGSIKPLVAGQLQDRELKIIKAMHADYEQAMVEVVRAFCHYYRFHKCKVVRYHFDCTAKQGRVGNSTMQFWQDVYSEFVKHGWEVQICYQHQTPTYQYRFDLFNALLSRANDSLPVFKYNKANCEWLEKSMLNARCRINSKGGLEKDKREEKNKQMDQRERPHYSDALEMLVVGELQQLENEGGEGYYG